MARKTKAELQAEREAALEAEFQREKAEYPQRLMAALEEAVNLNNYELTVVAGVFVLRSWVDRRSDKHYEFCYHHDRMSSEEL